MGVQPELASQNGRRCLHRDSGLHRLCLTVALVCLLAHCGGTAASSDDSEEPPPATPVTVAVEVFREGLNFPTKLAFAPDGRLFFSEKGGQVRIISNGELLAQPFATLETATDGERGVMGIAFDPDFGNNRWVYVFFSHRSGVNRVVRFTDANNTATSPTVILDGIASSHFHNAGHLAFDRDGRLYVSTGDSENPSRSQDPSSLNGKLLRLNRDGTPAARNPSGGSPAFAMGLRNPFGFAFHPQSGTLYLTDNGPTCDDELNRIVPGGNYGWRANYPCGDTDSRFIAPSRRYSEPIAPTGIIFYTGNVFPQFRNHILMAQFIGGKVRHIVVDDANEGKVTTEEVVFEGGLGGLIDIAQGPDGRVYLTTNQSILRMVAK